MKYWLIIILLSACSEKKEIRNMKDLEQSMMDLKIYQENLGDLVKAGTLEDAPWFLEGIDSILYTVSATITEHHKLPRPFSYYKERLLDKPIDALHKNIRDNDTASARRNYRIMVDKCNKCHIDLEIEKDVRY